MNKTVCILESNKKSLNTYPLSILFANRCELHRRRTTAAKAQTSRAPGPSTSGMMRIYTDDSPGLRV